MTVLLERLTGLRFLHPAVFWLAWLIPVLLLARLRIKRADAPLSTASFLIGLDSARSALRPLPRLLQAAGLFALVAALAQPVAREPLPRAKEGIDIVLCMDTSSSMMARDLDPARTRLEVARDAALDFVAARPQDRIGVVAFARYPDLACPPTLDHRALAAVLSDVVLVASDGPEDATGIGAAVARAAEVLQRGSARSKVVILLTDGEENVALEGAPDEIAPVHAAQLCERLGVRVYAIAAGLRRRDATGRWVRLDTRPIQRLAARTGGTFHSARDAQALDEVYARIDALERAPLEDVRFRLVDRRLLFLLAGLALLLFGRFLASTWLRVRP